MKFGDLQSTAHNFAASFGSGMGLLVGYYQADIFKDVKIAIDNEITIDFLTGSVTKGQVSREVRGCIDAYVEALDSFCIKHGGRKADFNRFVTIYKIDKIHRECFYVEIEDKNGKNSKCFYTGHNGKKIRPKR